MIEEYTVRLLDTLRPVISSMAPATYVSVLLGVINACAFYLVISRRFRFFIPCLVLGALAAVGGTTVGSHLPETGPLIGEVSVVAASLSTWTILLIARSIRL